MSKIRVLVVDDSLFMRRMITDILAEDRRLRWWAVPATVRKGWRWRAELGLMSSPSMWRCP